MKLIIEVDLIPSGDLSLKGQRDEPDLLYAKALVPLIEKALDGNSIIRESLDTVNKGTYGYSFAAGPRSIRVEGDPVLYGVKE